LIINRKTGNDLKKNYFFLKRRMHQVTEICDSKDMLVFPEDIGIGKIVCA